MIPKHKILVFFFLWMLSITGNAQIIIDFTVVNENSKPIVDADVYLKLSQNRGEVFIGFTDENGNFQRKIPDDNDGLFIRCLGYNDTLVTDLNTHVLRLTQNVKEFNEFVLIDKKPNIEMSAFELIQYSLEKGVKLYGDSSHVYSITVNDILQNVEAQPLYYRQDGYYLEDIYSAPNKLKNHLQKDKWTLDWGIYEGRENMNSNYYSKMYFPFVIYGLGITLHPNPINTITPLKSKNLKNDFDLEELPADSNTVKFQLKQKRKGHGSVYVLTISVDSVLLELETICPDTFEIKIPGKEIQKVGLGAYSSKRIWVVENEVYYLDRFLFSGYYFQVDGSGNRREFLISEKVTFSPINYLPKGDFKKIELSINSPLELMIILDGD